MKHSNKPFLKPYYIRSIEQIVDNLIDSGNVDEAVLLYERLTKHFKGNPNYFVRFGKLQMMREKYSTALAAIEQAIAIDPDFTEAHIRYCECYYKAGNIESAKRALSSAIRALACSPCADPERSQNFQNIKELCRALGTTPLIEECLAMIESNLPNGAAYDALIKKVNGLSNSFNENRTSTLSSRSRTSLEINS